MNTKARYQSVIFYYRSPLQRLFICNWIHLLNYLHIYLSIYVFLGMNPPINLKYILPIYAKHIISYHSTLHKWDCICAHSIQTTSFHDTPQVTGAVKHVNLLPRLPDISGGRTEKSRIESSLGGGEGGK